MLKLRTFSNNSPTSAVSLSEEYDEIQASNIFPSVQEDLSVSSNHAPMDSSHRSKSSQSSNHNGTSTTTAGSGNEVESLRAQVESLRQQLAERDSTVNELQRKIQEDKRAHEKLQQRFDLFLGGNNHHSTLNASFRGRMTDESMSLSTGEMQRLNKHIDQLEAEKEASFQKVLKLSVMLAESKAKCCTLESQVDEYQSLIASLGHNHSLAGIVNKFIHQNNSTSSSVVTTPKKATTHPPTPSTVATSTTTTSTTTSTPVTDINFNSKDFGVVNLDSDDDGDDNDNADKTPFDFEFDNADQLAWSTRGTPLTYVSERATSTRFNKRGQLARSNTERGTMATTPRRNSAGPTPTHTSKFKTGFLGFRGILSSHNVEEES